MSTPTVSSSSLTELRRIRIEKADAIRTLGLNPYPSTSAKTHTTAEVLANFEQLDGTVVTLAGRIMSWRGQGALAFAHIQDQTGKLQLFIKRDLLAATSAETGTLGFPDLHLLDRGDFIEATGVVLRTQRGEVSIQPTALRILAKSIRPLPDSWSGLQDREQVLRKRYLDTIMEPESHQRFAIIPAMIAAIRAFLQGRGFVEFQTPIIQPQYGGGTAQPFRTRVNALGTDMYLAISHELYLKRLIVAGYDKVFTVGRYFRNEGIDRSHHPEFSMVETMAAYENYEYNMNLIEDMFRHIAVNVFGKTTFTVKGQAIDFAPAWRRVQMAALVQEVTGVDFRLITSVEEARASLLAMEIKEPANSVGEALVLAFEGKAEATLVQPTLVYGQPVEISPLAKPMAHDARYAERFEIYIGGMECGDNWSEQNDPVHLLNTWKNCYNDAEADSGKFHTLDFDFIEALEHGMPPTTGIGPGLERMAMIFTEQENIDDVIFFPMMRRHVTPTNAAIYGLLPQEGDKPAAPDLALSHEEFSHLCATAVLQPAGPQLTIRPCLHLWPTAGVGQVTIDGFRAAGKLSLTGYRVPTGTDAQAAAQSFGELIEQGLLMALRNHFPACQLTLQKSHVVQAGV